MKILLTIDTELWPGAGVWPKAAPTTQDLELAYTDCVLGSTACGDFGVPQLLHDLKTHGLKAIFFVESLFAAAGGTSLLKRTVETVRDAGQDVQLHLHTEWLAYARHAELPRKPRQHLCEFNYRQQRTILAAGLRLLRHAGAQDLIAVRAGNLSGNADTTRAAGDAGLSLDFSMNTDRAVSHKTRDIRCVTLPLSSLYYPRLRQYRPVQLGAVSAQEMKRALLEHAAAGCEYFCILLHSFELVHRVPHRCTRVNTINLARWKQLCALLARYQQLFPTVFCHEIDRERAQRHRDRVVSGRSLDLPRRYLEQAMARLR